MPNVAIQGIGVVQFPDNMAPDAIQHAIETDILPKASAEAASKPSPSANLLPGEGALRQFAHGASFGFDAKLAGLVSAATGGDYQSARDAYEREADAYRVENPKTSFALNLAGGVAMGGGLAAKGAQAVGGLAEAGNAARAAGTAAADIPAAQRIAAAAESAIGGLSRAKQIAAISTGTGAVQGVVQGAGEAQGDALDYAKSIGKGALIGAAGGLVSSPIAMAGARLARAITGAGEAAAAPSAGALKAAASDAYDAAHGLGLQLAPQSLQNAAQNIRQTLETAGYRDYLAPKVYRALGELEQAGGAQSATLADLEGVRRLLGKAGGDLAEKDAARRATEGLDQFAHNLTPADVVAGDAGQATSLLGEARGNYAAAMRLGRLDTAAGKAELQAGAAGSGANIDNATRQQIKSVLNSPKLSRGFSPEEIDQMQQIVRGTFVGNAGRLLGKLAPTGIVSLAGSSGLGAAVGGAPGALVLPMIGYLGKYVGDASTRNQVGRLMTMVANRSPMGAAQAVARTPLANLLPASDATLAALLGREGSEGAQALLSPQSQSSARR